MQYKLLINKITWLHWVPAQIQLQQFKATPDPKNNITEK